MRYLRDIAVVFLILIILASLAIWCFSTEAQQSVTGKKFTCVYTFEQPNVPQPDTRIYVLVDADNEGDAAIKSFRHLAEKLTIAATEKLKFVEAQRKQ